MLAKLKDWNADDDAMTSEQQVHSWWADFIPIDPYKDQGYIAG